MSSSVPRVTSVPSRHASGAAYARRLRGVLAALSLLGALLVTASTASAAVWPTDDPFYTAPVDIASRAPGEVIRSRTTRIRTAPGVQLPFKTYQVLYRTTDRQEKPIATVATIILPLSRPAKDRKLVSYQTAYDGLSPSCMPSYSLQTGKVALQGAETLLMMGILSRGWTIVTADYEGPDNAWLTGKTTARGVLDGIRAAENFQPAGLTDGAATDVGMMGYSGGGQATAWASELAASYAPELNIVGAAQGGVAADFGQVMKSMDGQLFAGIALAAFVGISQGYPEAEFDKYLNNKGRATLKYIKKKQSCIMDFALAYPFVKIRSLTTVPDLLSIPTIKAAADDLALGKSPPSMPMFMYHTVLDQMEAYPAMLKLVKKYCSEGVKVQFVTGYKEEHAMQAFSMPFKAQAWMADRFAHKPMITNCAKPA